MPGRLTTHVLDTAHGHPAANVEVVVWRIGATGDRTLITTERTASDGRTGHPLLQGEELQVGQYELIFRIGAYFAGYSEEEEGVRFLDDVPVRFGIADPEAHYHVPLLVSPWAYSTYRGS